MRQVAVNMLRSRYAPLWALTALAFFLRLTLLNESVDLEEYVGLAFLNAPNLWEYLRQTHAEYRQMAPLPYAMQYLWSLLAGPAPWAIRLLFVLLGTATVPLAYAVANWLFGRERRGHSAGMIAAACIALSAVLILRSQEARQYMLVVLAGLLSVYTFLRARRDDRPAWWAANVAANFAIIASQPLCAIVPLLEGAFLAAAGPRRISRRTAVWFAAHALLAGYWLAWNHAMPTDPGSIYGFEGRNRLFLNVHSLLRDILADDCISQSEQARFSLNALWFLPEHLVSQARNASRYLDPLQKSLMALALAWGAVGVILGGIRRLRSKADTTRVPHAAELAFLIIWVVIPPTALAVVSTWIPCALSRYTSYGVIGLYLLLGGMVSVLPSVLRKAIGVLIAGLLLYQVVMMLPGPVRTDWKAVKTNIEERGSPRDLVLIQDHLMWVHIARFNYGDGPNPITGGLEEDALCRQGQLYLSLVPDAAVWYYMRTSSSMEFDKRLAEHGMASERTIMGGERPIRIYRATLQPGAALPSLPAESPLDCINDLYAAASPEAANNFRSFAAFTDDNGWGEYLRLAAELTHKGMRPEAAAVLAKTVEINPGILQQMVPFVRMMAGTEPGQAAATLKRLAGIHPEEAILLMAMADVPVESENAGTIVASLTQLLQATPAGNAGVRLRLATALAQQQKHEQANQVLLDGLNLEPNNAQLAAALANSLLAQGKNQEAVDWLRKARQWAPEDKWLAVNLANVLTSVGNYQDAVREVRAAFGDDPDEPMVWLLLWRSQVVLGDDAAAEKAARRYAAKPPPGSLDVMPVVAALYDAKDYDAAFKAIEALEAQQCYLPFEIREMVQSRRPK